MLESRLRTATLTALVIFGVLALTGCSLFAGSGTGLTLAETKSPVQLLRNSAATRVPDDLVKAVLSTTDESAACRTTEADPNGLLRSWRSTIRLELSVDADADDVIAELTKSFVDQGWTEGIYGTKSIIELTKGGSETVIHISRVAADVDAGAGAELKLQVNGPCVITEGETSDEVAILEAAG